MTQATSPSSTKHLALRFLLALCFVISGQQAILVPPNSDVPCDILRSGAPNSPNTDALNAALQAAEDCL